MSALRTALEQIKRMAETGEFGIAEVAGKALAAGCDIDLEAIAWAYQKLLAYGVGNTNQEQALMLDRLNLMLLGPASPKKIAVTSMADAMLAERAKP